MNLKLFPEKKPDKRINNDLQNFVNEIITVK